MDYLSHVTKVARRVELLTNSDASHVVRPPQEDAFGEKGGAVSNKGDLTFMSDVAFIGTTAVSVRMWGVLFQARRGLCDTEINILVFCYEAFVHSGLALQLARKL